MSKVTGVVEIRVLVLYLDMSDAGKIVGCSRVSQTLHLTKHSGTHRNPKLNSGEWESTTTNHLLIVEVVYVTAIPHWLTTMPL